MRKTTAAVLCALVASAGIQALESPALAEPPQSCVKASEATADATADDVSAAIAQKINDGMHADDVTQYLQSQWCFTTLNDSSGTNAVSALASPDETDVNVHVGILYDHDVNHYYAIADFSWLNETYTYGENLANLGCSSEGVGGRDGFGIRFTGEETVDNIQRSLTLWNNPALEGNTNRYDGGPVGTSNAYTTGHGTFFTWQDNIRQVGRGSAPCAFSYGGVDYDSFGGVLVLRFDLIGGNSQQCFTTQAVAEYDHTYRDIFNGDITGASVGPWSFGLSWSNQDNSFKHEALSGPSYTICPNVDAAGGPWPDFIPIGGGGGGGTSPPSGIAVKRNDYNRDGNSDIVAVRDDYLHIWFGTGTGGFVHGGTVGAGWTAYASTLTAAGDVNRDGNGDIVAVYNDYLHIWFGTGSGGFVHGGTVGAGWTPYASTLTGIGDINNDGNGDLVAVYNDYLYTWYGTGSGGFAFAGTVGSGWTPYASSLATPGDINRDGKGDLVAVYNDYLHVWLGTGSGGFIYNGTYGSGWGPYASTLTGMGDINRDGKGDLVAIANDYLQNWFGTGSGGFTYAGSVGSGWAAYVPIH